jgi:hypothetical protein
MGTDASAVVCPEGDATYTVTVTDSKGCETTAEVEVNAVDITCGSGSAGSPKSCAKADSKTKVIVCIEGKSKVKESCKKLKSLKKSSKCKRSGSLKSASKTITLGPCSIAADYDGCDIAALSSCPVGDTCVCEKGISSITLQYVGPNGGSLYITDKCDTLGAWTGLSTGDKFIIDTDDLPLSSSSGSGSKSKLPKDLVVSGLGLPAELPADCKQLLLGGQFGSVVVCGFIDAEGNECGVNVLSVDATINLLTDSFGGETSWSLRDVCSGDVIAEETGPLASNTSTSTTLELAPGTCYEFTIFDSFGDGICCFWGVGSYEIIYDGAVVGSGGDFGSSETVQFGSCPCEGFVDATVNLNTDSFGGETSWQIDDQCTGSTVASGSGYASNSSISVGVSLNPDHCYDFTIFDSFGDGMCCSWGIGSYSFEFDGAIVASGGDFGASETTSFGSCPCGTAKQGMATEEAQAGDVLSQDISIQAFPNPFNSYTNIQFSVPTATDVALDIYTVSGAKVRTLFSGAVEAGQTQNVRFDGQGLTDGIYFYTLKTATGANVHGKVFLRR